MDAVVLGFSAGAPSVDCLRPSSAAHRRQRLSVAPAPAAALDDITALSAFGQRHQSVARGRTHLVG
jgi:hypothetical protein